MRTVFAKILLWSFGTLLLSLAAYLFISEGLASRFQKKGGPFERMVAFQVDEAEETYRLGGSAALGTYLKKLRIYFGPEHFFTDPQGKDLVNGADRSGLLALAHGERNSPHAVGDRFVFVAATRDGAYRLIATGKPPFTRWSFLPYYGLVLVVVALLCWMLAINIASPLRALAHTVERFGRGDLSARVESRRHDEIGGVARAFDRMADRIETLLTAERRLLQDISHELRSPLARLSFAAELTRTAADREAAVARMKKEIERLTSLVGSLVEVTRVEGDPSARRVEAVDVEQLVRELLEASRMEADARGCRLQFEAQRDASPAPPYREELRKTKAAPGAPSCADLSNAQRGAPLAPPCSGITVQGDRELLRRAVENVLRNAIRYAPQGSAIEVRLASSGGMASLAVRDYGPGVPEEMLPKIFQPFFRVDGSRDSQTGGVGLGLAIAHRAIGAHHGTIAAENAAPGLRVRMVIPL